MTTAPSGVWTSTWPPRAASVMVMGIWQCRSSPSRRYKGCASTWTTRMKSPGSPPRWPAFPAPARRMRLPSFTPAGSSTSSQSLCMTRPSPAQRAQAWALSEPDPLHSPQRRLKIMRPRWERTWPVPAHSGQETGPMARVPAPPQASQRSSRTTWRRRRVGWKDSSKVMRTDSSRSSPRWAPSRAAGLRPRTPAKMSWKPAPPTRTSAEKSKPSKPISGTADSRGRVSPRS